MSMDGKDSIKDLRHTDMSPLFDRVAGEYHATAPEAPPEYCQLIIRQHSLGRGTRVVELGCGSGALSRQLASYGLQVYGVDSSREFLKIAREQDKDGSVEWVHAFAEEYVPEGGQVDLVLAHEAFHLFTRKEQIVQNAATILRPRGAIAVGWCEYHWELALRDCIISTFQSFGIDWGEWGYQQCREFDDLILANPTAFGSCRVVSTRVHQQTLVDGVAGLLASIGKAAQLDSEVRTKLRCSLMQEFRQKFGSSQMSGSSTYWLRTAIRKNG